MTAARIWIVKVLTPIWVALYLVILRGISGFIFVPLVAYLGIWKGALVAVLIYGVWGTVLYLLLLQTDSFEKLPENVNHFLENKNWKVVVWLRKKIANRKIKITPWWIVLVFIFESPLTGVPLIRLTYPRERWLIGLSWIWFGALLEVVTWFLPVYGGGMTLIKFILAL